MQTYDSPDLLISIFFIIQCCTDQPFALAEHKQRISTIFNLPTLEEIYVELEKDGSEWALKTLTTLQKMVLYDLCQLLRFIEFL